MSMIPVSEKNVLAVVEPAYTTATKVRQKILEEEEYLSILDKIVERDFYPELAKLKLRSEYLGALETNDLEKLREIQLQLEKDTPYLIRKQTPRIFDVHNEDEKTLDMSSEEHLKSKLTLDSFLVKNTSEDNASFEKVMEVARKKHRVKYAWLFEKQNEQQNKQDLALALPASNEEQLKAVESQSNNVETWKYVPKNALMYPPEGVQFSVDEIIEKNGKKEREICHENTRFKCDPFDTSASHAALLSATHDRINLQKAVGKIGVDGKLEESSVTPSVCGYGFVATPSPAPGVDASPMMTWGELEGAPLRIDATPSHSSQTPTFKIPEPPHREQLAYSLAEKASKQHREKRRKAFAAATASLRSPSPRYVGSDRLSKLSPAAQKLIKSSVRINTDKSLRSSYSPVPVKGTPYPQSVKGTPGSSRRTKTPGSNRIESSITDNLLQLPKI